MSIVGSVMQGLSPEVISRMASGLGAPQDAIPPSLQHAERK
jgi:hypothetical protein